MDCTATRIPYRQTNAFSNTMLDYIDQSDSIKTFQAWSPTIEGIQAAIEERKKFDTDRELLVNTLKEQYKTVNESVNTEKNIESLLKDTSFTITTAHQPNIFTGPLYFIYKILHAIKLAESCKTLFPQYDFVPVYYMGSEDADLDELGHFYVDGEKKVWNTKQAGAVGRMLVDKELIKLITSIEGQLVVLPHGDELVSLIKESYKEGATIADATFALVNTLFADYGLLVLQPDNAALKRTMVSLFEDDLFNQAASGIVEKSAGQLNDAGYKVQANPREINLFYLDNNIRERIIEKKGQFTTAAGSFALDKAAMQQRLKDNPEQFSPNVILRGLYQETILPNIIFIGGGGETAYWLQLKELFRHYKTPFPVLVLRNSFMIVERKWKEKIEKLGFGLEDLFLKEDALLNKLVARDTDKKLLLNGTLSATEEIYDSIKRQAAAIDGTLEKHVDALKTRSIQRLQELEKKMLRAEKRKYTAQQRQISFVKEKLFPKSGLQERIDNFMPAYAKWGKEFIEELYQHSLSLEQEFVVLVEN